VEYLFFLAFIKKNNPILLKSIRITATVS